LTQEWGSLDLMSNDLYVNTQIGDLVFDTVVINGVTHKRCTITSKQFSFYDVVTKKTYPAWVHIVLTQLPPYGVANFVVTRVSDGVITHSSVTASNQSGDTPLTYGNVSIL
jgi:hypothetical protein